MRDERYFSPDPEVWRPERWLHPEKETVLNKEACELGCSYMNAHLNRQYATGFPFSVGP